mgnify:CR=1 FL=1
MKKSMCKYHISIKGDTMNLLLDIKAKEQEKEIFNVTNDIVIRKALQAYAERKGK